MSEETLAEQVARIQPGDWVHAVFSTPRTSSGEWEVKGETSNAGIASDGLCIVYSAILLRYHDKSPTSHLLRIEEHRPAPRPFYTNRGADRQPRRGDLIDDHKYRGLLVYDGRKYWWQYSSGIALDGEPGKHALAGELFEDQP